MICPYVGGCHVPGLNDDPDPDGSVDLIKQSA